MYVNEYVVTAKRFREWSKLASGKPVNIAFRAIWILLAVAMIVYAVVYRYIYLLHVVLILFCIYNAFFRWMVQSAGAYRKLSKIHGKDWKRQIFFGDTIRVVDERQTVDLVYHDIKDIKETSNLVQFVFRNNLKLRVYKDCFTVGTWEECAKYIAQKRGES